MATHSVSVKHKWTAIKFMYCSSSGYSNSFESFVPYFLARRFQNIFQLWSARVYISKNQPLVRSDHIRKSPALALQVLLEEIHHLRQPMRLGMTAGILACMIGGIIAMGTIQWGDMKIYIDHLWWLWHVVVRIEGGPAEHKFKYIVGPPWRTATGRPGRRSGPLLQPGRSMSD